MITANTSNMPEEKIQQEGKKRPAKSSRGVYVSAVVVLVVILTGVLGAGGMLLWKAYKDAPVAKSEDTISESSEEKVEEVVDPNEEIPETLTYTSDALGIGLTYPSDWDVIERDSSNAIILRSPLIMRTMYGFGDGSNEKSRVSFEVSISKSDYSSDEGIGLGGVIYSSEKLTFAQPFNGSNTTHTAVYAEKDKYFAGLTLTGPKQYSKGDSIEFSGNYNKKASVMAGYIDPLVFHQDVSYDWVVFDGYNETDVYKEGIEIIKSLHDLK